MNVANKGKGVGTGMLGWVEGETFLLSNNSSIEKFKVTRKPKVFGFFLIKSSIQETNHLVNT